MTSDESETEGMIREGAYRDLHETTEGYQSSTEIQMNRLEAAKNAVAFYGYPLILATGILFNTISFFVILKSKIITISTGVYLAVLTWVDTSAIIQWVLLLWSGPIPRTAEFVNSCSVRIFILTCSTHMGSMCAVGITVDRFIAVWFPFRAKQICKRKTAAMVLATAFLCILAMYIPMLFAFNPNCTVNPALLLYASKVVFMLSFIFHTYGPIGILLFTNIGITVKLLISAKFKKASRVAEDGGIQTKVMATVLAVSWTYIICLLPYNILISLTVHEGYQLPAGLAQVLITGAELLKIGNHSVNFYIYILTSQNFRSTFVDILCSWRRKFKSQREAVINSVETETSRVRGDGLGLFCHLISQDQIHKEIGDFNKSYILLTKAKKVIDKNAY